MNFRPEQIGWRDRHGNERAAAPTPPSGWRRFTVRGGAAAATGLADTAAQLADGWHPCCPLGHEIPPGMAERRTLVLALTGDSGSGKTHYLAALTPLLLAGALAPFDMMVEIAPGSIETYHDRYAPLSESRRRLAPTPPVAEGEIRTPLMFLLHNLRTDTTTNLLVYDTAGDQLTGGAAQARSSRFLYGADGVFVLVPAGALRFPAAGPLQDKARTAGSIPRASTMMSQLAHGLREVPGRGRDSPLDAVSVAVILSKADQLAGQDGLPPPAELPDVGGAAELRRIQRDSESMAEFLVSHGAANLVVQVAYSFVDTTYHAMSATGCAVDPDSGLFPRVDSQGCLDPFLSFLVRRGVIAVTEAD